MRNLFTFDMSFVKLLYVYLQKKRKELTLLEARVNSAFLVEKNKHFFVVCLLHAAIQKW